MATKPIPPGSCNFAINVPRAWRLTLGKAAHARGLSLGELLKRAAEDYLRDEPATARRLTEIRLSAAKLAVVIALLAGIGAQWVSHAKGALRARTASVRVVKGQRRSEWPGEWEVA